jgi:hypothetical protein
MQSATAVKHTLFFLLHPFTELAKRSYISEQRKYLLFPFRTMNKKRGQMQSAAAVKHTLLFYLSVHDS